MYNLLITSTLSLMLVSVVCAARIGIKGELANSLSVGGEYINEGEAPWLSPIYDQDEYLCGSSLVSSQFVLTAAHCIHFKDRDPIPASNLIIYAGTYNLDYKNNQSVQKFPAIFHKIHPNWDADSERYDADIALIKLCGTVLFSEFVQKISLPTDSLAKKGLSGFVVGYGISENRTDHEIMPRRVKIPIVDGDECLNNHPIFQKTLSRDTFCAGRKGVVACPGDSGSSFYLIKNSSPVLVGVVSSGIKKRKIPCKIDNFAMFTDVIQFKDWIEFSIAV